MTINDLTIQARPFSPIVFIDRVFPPTLRSALLRAATVMLFIVLVYTLFALTTTLGGFTRGVGLVMIIIGFWFVVFAVSSYTFSKQLRGDNRELALSFETAFTILTSDRVDLTAGFLSAPAGKRVWRRLGLGLNDREAFYSERAGTISNLSIPDDMFVDLEIYIRALLESDEDLHSFLRSRSITLEDAAAAASWVERELSRKRDAKRWWSKEQLRKYPSLGGGWHFGQTPTLDRYSRSISSTSASKASSEEYYGDEADRIEAALSRDRSVNVLLIGQVGSGLEEAVSVFAKRVERGVVTPELERHRVLRLDAGLLVALGNRVEVEKTMLKVLAEAQKSSDTILVIEHLPSFLGSLDEVGVNGIEMLEPYFKDARVRTIATVTPDQYHSSIEHKSRLRKWFTEISIEKNEAEQMVRLLEDKVLLRENATGGDFLVTYPAVEAIYNSASRYITDQTMPDSALDLLDEVVSVARHANKPRVTAAFVYNVVEEKTGIPTGDVKESERDKLLNLEEILHKRIVGQETAVQAVSEALRRSRSGIADPSHPLGVFLFLGPTGVGKTETAKVLADTMFNGRDDMVRIDMSEFSGVNGLNRLIGNRKEGISGVLSTAVLDNPYSVLLLDEFEKANRDVHDLFLRIFDEGIFHDAFGKEINLRNMIIIATSNAASSEIRNLVNAGKSLLEHKNELVDQLIQSDQFRPELINRFDEVVLFHPLSDNEARAVAEHELAKLQARLNERGVTFEITEPVVDYLVEHGYDEQFGARSIRRIINSDIEQVISNKLILGEVRPGDTVVVTEDDLKSIIKKKKKQALSFDTN